MSTFEGGDRKVRGMEYDGGGTEKFAQYSLHQSLSTPNALVDEYRTEHLHVLIVGMF